jgi:hypothetical protein
MKQLIYKLLMANKKKYYKSFIKKRIFLYISQNKQEILSKYKE